MGNQYRFRLHPDYRVLASICLPFCAPLLRLASPVQRLALRLTPVGREVQVRRLCVKTASGRVRVLLLEPRGAKGPLPAVLDIHGGGFGYRAAPSHKKLAARYATGAMCRVVMPDYRLLPRHRYPAAATDVAAVWRWMGETAQAKLFVQDKMAVMGDSAGGALAAGLCNSAERLGLRRPCQQLLIYPVTDARMETLSMERYRTTPMWNAQNNEKMWRMYLRGTSRAQRANASPMEQELPEHIPPTYVETAEIDCLHDEAITYAARLRDAGARVGMVQTYGTPHGFDTRLDCETTRDSIHCRVGTLQRAFWPKQPNNGF